MPPQIASLVYAALILGLFWLDRDHSAKTSKALWIPTIWLLINASRPVSQWLQVAPTGNSADVYLEGSPVDAAVFEILLVTGLIVLVARRRKIASILRLNLPLLLFFSYCALSTLWSDYTFVATKRWIKATGDLVMILVVLSDPQRVQAIKRLLSRTAFLLIPLSVLLIKYYPDWGRTYDIWTWVPSYTGVTTNKNELGMTCLVLGLASLWRVLEAYGDRKSGERTRLLVVHLTMIGSVIWLLWIADSMTSLSCLVMAGGLLALTTLSKFGRKRIFVNICVALILVASIAALFLDVGGGALGAVGRDSTLTGRTYIWNIVLAMVRHPLFGTGFDSFWLGDRLQKVWDGFGLHIIEAHNGYLDVYLNLGWFGVIFLAGLIIAGYKNAVATLRRDPGLGGLFLAYFVAEVAYNLTESAFGGSAIWIAFLLAIVVVPGASKRRQIGVPTFLAEVKNSFVGNEETQEKYFGLQWTAERNR